MQDVDQMRRIIERWPEMLENDQQASAPPLHEWTLQTGLLAAILDRLAEVINAVVASAGGEPGKVKAYPRPVTALDVIRREFDEAEMEDLLGIVRYAD